MSLLALLDDIATVLDDVSLMTRAAAQKTAGVVGDDLALSAQQVVGLRAERELPVVMAVARGSLKNKAILVPAALLISALIPWAIIPVLMVGGAFLCYEGFEKLAHRFLVDPAQEDAAHAEKLKALSDPNIDLVAFEKEKIKGAIRTDFILSAEIIVITLGTVKDASLGMQIAVLSGIAVLMTVGVYALVAGIVKIDDAGLHLLKDTAAGVWSRFKRRLGSALLRSAPYLMKTLSVVGTIAMFIVGGSILLHGVPGAESLLHHAAEYVRGAPWVGGLLAAITPLVLHTLTGILAGAIVLAVVTVMARLLSRVRSAD